MLGADIAISRAIFDHRYVYITAGPGSGNPVPRTWRSVPTVNFKSYAAFSAAVASGTMPRWTEAVLYDPEAWPQTPRIEQINVKYYMSRFYRLARRQGWQVLVTPGTDLMKVYHRLPGETIAQAFVRYDVAGAAARYANVSETQSQGAEASPETYRWFLASTRAQALAANPHDVFLGGLTADLLGTTESARVIYEAAISATKIVTGFFLNVSRNYPDPVHAARFLRELAAYHQPSGGALASVSRMRKDSRVTVATHPLGALDPAAIGKGSRPDSRPASL
jgi:hypothetical protein